MIFKLFTKIIKKINNLFQRSKLFILLNKTAIKK